jgi:hydroxybutyrate-dimer hydrolase
LLAALLLGACAGSGEPRQRVKEIAMPDFLVSPVLATRHAEGDDLLSAGLGLAGLRAMAAPAVADAAAPTPLELRRRALWTNWRGIADLAPGGGFGDIYGSLPSVTGREFSAFAKVPGAKQPHRVLLQLPDAFDTKARCLVVAVSSGSRGIYGAIALAGAWGLPRGCAVAYTDKGAGTGYFDVDSDSGVKLDGTRGTRGEGLEFEPARGDVPAHTVAVKHAHSGDNPEADWGRHALQAAQFALAQLSAALPQQPRFDFGNTRVIAVGLSNGGGAVLRLAELDAAKQFAGIVAIAPNVYPGIAAARPLFDYTTDAALLQPCALLDPAFDKVALARPGGGKPPAWVTRCAALHERGVLGAATTQAQAAQARERLHAGGFTDAAIEAGALTVSFDLWRAVGAAYAAAYGRYGAGDMPCGSRYAALDAQHAPRASTVAERAVWASDSSGIPPHAPIGLIDSKASGADANLPGLLCLRDLWSQHDGAAQRVQQGIGATRASLPQVGVPLIVIHGTDDGIIPEAFAGGAYARWAQEHGRALTYWRVHNAQHFDAFLGLPPLAARYVPLLPYAYRALDAMWAHVADQASLPGSAEIAATPRGFQGAAPAPLTREQLALP